MDKSAKALAKTLAAVMERDKKTVADLNRDTKITRRLLSGYLNGIGATLSSLDRLAEALNVEPWQLIKPDEDLLSPKKRELIRLIIASDDKEITPFLDILRTLHALDRADEDDSLGGDIDGKPGSKKDKAG